MGLMKYVIWSIFCCETIIYFAQGNTNTTSDNTAESVFQDDSNEERAKLHRLELMFPLLLKISSRLAVLVPSALMTMAGVFVFILFSKKALIVSLLTLFMTITDKVKKSQKEIIIHKVNSYEDHDDEEHHFYYHHHHPPPPPPSLPYKDMHKHKHHKHRHHMKDHKKIKPWLKHKKKKHMEKVYFESDSD